MATGIRKRGNSYAVSVSVQGTRETCTVASFEQAQAKQAEIRARLYTGLAMVAAKKSCWTLEEASNACLAAIWKGTPNEEPAERNASYAVAFFGADVLLDSIGTIQIDAYIASLKDAGNSNGTVNRKLAALSRIMTFARESEMMSRTPKIRKQVEEGAHTVPDLGRRDYHVGLLLYLADGLSRRVHLSAGRYGDATGELWRVKPQDITLDQGPSGLLSIWKAKSKKPRSIPMTPRVREIIMRRMELTAKGEVLFPHDNQWMRRGWDKVKRAMHLQSDAEFVPHSLRHTCASRLLQRKVPLLVVKEWLGHKTLSVTVRYGHLRPEDMYEAVTVLSGGCVTRTEDKTPVSLMA